MDAQRLTYDHKASDEQEEERVRDLGGFVACGRVNGTMDDVGARHVGNSVAVGGGGTSFVALQLASLRSLVNRRKNLTFPLFFFSPGLLAVSRSIGDLLMKEFVVSTPYCRELIVEPSDT